MNSIAELKSAGVHQVSRKQRSNTKMKVTTIRFEILKNDDIYDKHLYLKELFKTFCQCCCCCIWLLSAHVMTVLRTFSNIGLRETFQ